MKITEEDFKEYEAVRQSGITNMWNVKLVCDITGLEREQVMEIMKTYSKLAKQYPYVRNNQTERAEEIKEFFSEGEQ